MKEYKWRGDYFDGEYGGLFEETLGGVSSLKQTKDRFRSTDFILQRERPSITSLAGENQILRERVSRLQSQTAILQSQNKYIKNEFTHIINQLNKSQQLQETQQSLKHIEHSFNSTLILQHYKSLQALNENLNKQIDLLMKIKDKLEGKLTEQKQKARILYAEIEKYEQKIDKQVTYNQKCEKQIMKLSNQLTETRKQIYQAMSAQQRRNYDTDKLHSRMQRQLEKLKQKCSKYKNRSEQYRQQRDILLNQLEQGELALSPHSN